METIIRNPRKVGLSGYGYTLLRPSCLTAGPGKAGL